MPMAGDLEMHKPLVVSGAASVIVGYIFMAIVMDEQIHLDVANQGWQYTSLGISCILFILGVVLLTGGLLIGRKE